MKADEATERSPEAHAGIARDQVGWGAWGQRTAGVQGLAARECLIHSTNVYILSTFQAGSRPQAPPLGRPAPSPLTWTTHLP